MRPPLRIAILECDTPIESVDRRYNGYYGLFSQLFHECAKSLGLDPETGLDITRWDVVHAQEYPKLEDIDAIVHTGSSKSPEYIIALALQIYLPCRLMVSELKSLFPILLT
ncbi:unnamed protein product [Aspergillus oryzae]|nr:unnamed protein product [Aspergillus oryzae]